MSTELAMATDSDSNPLISRRSRSSSITGLTSPESQSSDSPSSSDPDTLPPFSNTTAVKSLFAMEIDTVSNPHMMDMEGDEPFRADFEPRQVSMHGLHSVNALQGFNMNLDDVVLNGISHVSTESKTDMLMLEEIIKDGAFEPASTVGPPFQAYTSRSPTYRDLFNPHPPHFVHPSHPQVQPDPACIDPSSTQQNQSQPNFQEPSHAPSAVNASSLVTSESSGVLLLSPASQTSCSGYTTPLRPDPSSSRPLSLSYDPAPSTLVSNEVVHPDKDSCVDLPIFFPSVPTDGTKSRVETQIKLIFELGFPVPTPSAARSPDARSASLATPQLASSSSSAAISPTVSPAPGKREVSNLNGNSSRLPTHDKVGSYRFIRLPRGTATKRRAASIVGAQRASGRYSDPKVDETLEMAAEVVCCSPPHAAVQSCLSCQSREAKRTARKLAARVRPPHGSRSKTKPKKSGKKGRERDAETETDMDEDEDAEPNVDSSIIQFNCAEIVDFDGGSTVLPMRITCYCRHHKEKVGFNIIFTLRDHLGRIVGRGTTPPILITDDHKSNNAVSKLPPMHPLRQALLPPPSSSIAASNHPDPSTSQSTQDWEGRTLSKRRDADSMGKKRRPKPYDGRPSTRTAGVGPGLEGRQGVVLALHPAHAKAQASTAKGSASGSTAASSRETTASPGVESSVSPAQRSETLPPALPENSLPSPPPSLSGIVVPKRDMNMSTIDSCPGFSRHVSPPGLASFLPTAPPSPSSISSLSSSQPECHHIPPSGQALPDLQAFSSEHQAFLDTTSFPSFPPLPFTSLPTIHRLIPSSGPTTGGIEVTVLGSNFHASLPLECVFGGMVASSTHRWSDNTLVCILPPRATPGIVGVGFKGIKDGDTAEDGGACLFNYVDESDRQLMELALQVVGLKMTGKIEEARSVAMRIVGNTNTPTPAMTNGEVSQMNMLSGVQLAHHSFLGSISGMDLETLIIKLLTLLDVPPETGVITPLASSVIGHQNATGQTLLHLAVILALPALVSCLAQRSIDLDARNNNGLTALHFAALTGWKEGVEMLLSAGADATIVDGMDFTAADRARCSRSPELERLLVEASERDQVPEGGSGEEGDDEAWHNEDEASEDADSEEDASTAWPTDRLPQYTVRSRMASPSPTDSSLELSEFEKNPRKGSAQIETTPSEVPIPPTYVGDKPSANEKQEPSLVGRLQRTLPQGILPNMQIPGLPQLQIPGLPQLQLPDMLAGPWGALPQIPVFPVFVPIPNLPHLPNWPAFPWTDAIGGEKKETPNQSGIKHQQQPPFAMLWTAYDNIANNAWRAHWEKWTAQVTALQNANNPSTEMPPMYTPREKERQSEAEHQLSATLGDGEDDNVRSSVLGDVQVEDTPVASSSRVAVLATKATRRIGYNGSKVPDTEINSYHYQPKKKPNHKKDRMLIVFWIPILFIGLAYALYTTVPVAFAGVSRATKRLIPQLPQRDETPV